LISIIHSILGPKWREELKARNKRAPTVISTHSSLLDAFNWHGAETCMLVCRSNVVKLPAIGSCVMGMSPILINRFIGKDKLKEAALLISERQRAVERGDFPNRVFLCPEGMTSNGRFVCEFKRGAFDSLLPIEPWVHVPHSSNVSPAFDCIPQYMLCIFILCNFHNNSTHYILP